jgi:putative transposase
MHYLRWHTRSRSSVSVSAFIVCADTGTAGTTSESIATTRALRLNKRRKGTRRLPSKNPMLLAASLRMNECGSADFMSNVLWQGRRFCTFNVVDDFNREGLAIEVALNLPSERVVRVLERIAAWRGYPQKLRLDNGPELVAIALAEWAEEHKVQLEFIEPGKPMPHWVYREV